MADRPHLAEIFAAGDAIPAGVRIGDLVYLARIDGRDPSTGALPARVEDQLVRAFQNARGLLEQAGATLDNVAHVTIFLRDLGDRGAINPPWLATFPDASDRPTYKYMAGALPSGVRAQLQILAVAGARRRVLEIAGLAHGNPIPMGVQVGNLVVSSRIFGRDPRTQALGEGPAGQAAQAFQNMRTLLALAGCTPEHVSQVTIFVKEPGFREAAEAPWQAMFPDARTRPVRHDLTEDLPGSLQVMVEFLAQR